jgi:hypothetical protein
MWVYETAQQTIKQEQKMKTGKYRGWKNGETFGVDLGNNKAKAIKQAKEQGLDMVLKIGGNGKEGEWVY